jgi:hypothetical protein
MFFSLSGLEYGFFRALLANNGWVPSAADIDQVYAACGSDDCRKQVEFIRGTLIPPIAISFSLTFPSWDYAEVGSFNAASPQQLAEKIGQFPKGTQFYLQRYYEGTWYYSRRREEVQRLLTDLGMLYTEAPAVRR